MDSAELPSPELPSRNSRAYLPLLATVLLIAGMLSWGLMPLCDPGSKVLCFFFVFALVVGAWFLGRIMQRRAIARLSPAAADLAVRRWQFTIREMLLGSVAFALLLGLITASRPMATTPFFNFHNAHSEWGTRLAKSVCGKMGFPMVHFYSGDAGTTWFGAAAWMHRGACVSSAPAKCAPRVVAEAAKEIEAQLKQHGCRLRTTRVAAEDAHRDYHDD